MNRKHADDENDCLLDTIEDMLPIGKFPCEKVGIRHNKAVHESRSRAVENLREHFNIFVNKKPPTGDPDCPPVVVRAKLIDPSIKDKAGDQCRGPTAKDLMTLKRMMMLPKETPQH